MKESLCKALLVLTALQPATGNADEEIQADSGQTAQPATSSALDSLLFESKYAPRWQLLPAPTTTAYIVDWPNPMSNLRFQDASTLARVSRIRKLSLLTLARTGQTRLFLGVNEKGVLGVHFSALALRGDDDYVELARMPYLTPVNEQEAADEAN
ncbi:MAG: hypothetical protein ACR2Q3_14900 [Woeseiaceae bacterium]